MKNLLCIVFITALISVGCTSDEEVAEAESQLKKLKVERKDVRNSLTAKKERLRKLEYLIKQEESTRTEVTHLSDGNHYHDTELKQWRDAHRAALVGEKAGYLSKMDGVRIPKVEIIKVGDEKLEILSNGQPMTINISELATSVQQRLVYEPKIK